MTPATVLGIEQVPRIVRVDENGDATVVSYSGGRRFRSSYGTIENCCVNV